MRVQWRNHVVITGTRSPSHDLLRRIASAIATLAVAVAAPVGSEAVADTTPSMKHETRRVAMRDGTELNVCLSWPPGAQRGQRFPVLLTTDPYAGTCGQFGRAWYADYVQGGYVVAYAQVRGSGDSAGTFPAKEYSDEELDDAVTMIEWLARQPWSTGRVGMFGTSWSGFNSMLVAARRPPALKAIVTFMATENLYHEDARYPDGIFHVDDYVMFADLMLISTPPGRDPFDERLLRERFDQSPWSLVYLRQQRDGEFWRRSLRRNLDPAAGDVPTMMVGAWHDPYRTAVLRALEHSRGPVQAVIGPWNHSANFPGPTADLGQITIRWWNRFLKDAKSSALEGPQVTVYMRRPYRPIVDRSMIPGEWREFGRWQDVPIDAQRWSLTADRSLARTAGTGAEHRLRMVPSTGVSAGLGWIDIAPDQRPGDAQGLVYESAPLDRELQILGQPVAYLRTAVDAAQANWFVKLSDVAPDGTTTLITGGALNGAHRASSVAPEPLVPGRMHDLELRLHFTSWILQPGHRIRASVANALFPAYWPSAQPLQMTLGVGDGGSALVLPVIPPQTSAAADRAAAAVGSANVTVAAAEAATTGKSEYTWNGPVRSQVLQDDIARTTTVTRGYQWESPDGEDVTVEFTVSDADPARSSFVGRAFLKGEWQGQPVEWRGTTEIRSDATAFEYRHVRQLLRDGKVVREREWKERVPRDFQ